MRIQIQFPQHFSISEHLIQLPLQHPLLGIRQGVELAEVMVLNQTVLIEAEDVAEGDAVDDFGRGEAVGMKRKMKNSILKRKN